MARSVPCVLAVVCALLLGGCGPVAAPRAVVPVCSCKEASLTAEAKATGDGLSVTCSASGLGEGTYVVLATLVDAKTGEAFLGQDLCPVQAYAALDVQDGSATGVCELASGATEGFGRVACELWCDGQLLDRCEADQLVALGGEL